MHHSCQTLEDASSIPSPSALPSEKPEQFTVVSSSSHNNNKAMTQRDRPSHDLETAARLSFVYSEPTTPRVRARTQDTHVMDIDDTSSSDEYSSVHQDNLGIKNMENKDGIALKQQCCLFGRLLHRPRTHPSSLVQRIIVDSGSSSSDESEETSSLVDVCGRDCEREGQQDSKADSKGTRRTSARKPCSSSGGSTGTELLVEKSTHETASDDGILEISLPQPQKRQPPSNPEVLRLAPQRPSPALGSVGGAFTRYHPTVEGVPRAVTSLDNVGLKISWMPLEMESGDSEEAAVVLGRDDDENDDNDDQDSNCHALAKNHQYSAYNTAASSFEKCNQSVASTGSGEETTSFVMSLPKMSGIASASAAWQHMSPPHTHNNKNNNKAAGSVRTGTETSGSLDGDDDNNDNNNTDDGISLLSSARPPSSLTVSSSSQAGWQNCHAISRWMSRNNRIPKWLRKAPVWVQIMTMLIAVSIMAFLLVVLALTLVRILSVQQQQEEPDEAALGQESSDFDESLALEWAETEAAAAATTEKQGSSSSSDTMDGPPQRRGRRRLFVPQQHHHSHSFLRRRNDNIASSLHSGFAIFEPHLKSSMTTNEK